MQCAHWHMGHRSDEDDRRGQVMGRASGPQIDIASKWSQSIGANVPCHEVGMSLRCAKHPKQKTRDRLSQSRVFICCLAW